MEHYKLLTERNNVGGPKPHLATSFVHRYAHNVT